MLNNKIVRLSFEKIILLYHPVLISMHRKILENSVSKLSCLGFFTSISDFYSRILQSVNDYIWETTKSH